MTIEFAASINLPTGILQHHLTTGKKVLWGPDAEVTNFNKRTKKLTISSSDLEQMFAALSKDLTLDDRARWLLETNWIRTVYHEAGHSYLDYYLQQDPSANPMAARVQKLYSAAVEHFKENPKLENGRDIIDFDRVAHEAIADYIGITAFAYSYAVVVTQDFAMDYGADAASQYSQRMLEFSDEIRNEPTGYQPRFSDGAQLGVVTPLPESIRDEIDQLVFYGIQWDAVATPAVRRILD